MHGLSHRNLKSRLLGGASALAMTGMFTAGLPALAQEQQDDDDIFRIEEIIVTATKRGAMNIQDVGQSITAFSTAQIERIGILDMADVASNIPSISLSSYRAGLNELVYRGLSTSSDWRLESQVAVYLDDIPMTSATTQIDPRMVDIERVESLPGPQGTLFGSSSQTGTLRFITNKPNMDAFSGQLNAEYKFTKGGEGSYDINGHLNIPVSENFAIRIAAYKVKEGGYIDNVFSTVPHSMCAPGADCDLDWDSHDLPDRGPGYPAQDYEDPLGYLNSATPDNAAFVEDNYNDYDIEGIRIAALWNVSDDWSALLSLMHQSTETTGIWESDTGIGDYKVARFSDEWRTDEWSLISLQLKGDLGFAQLSNSFAFVDRKQAYHFDNTHYEAWHTRQVGHYYSNWQHSYNSYWDYYYPGYYPDELYNYYDKYDTDYNGGVYRSLQDAERITNELRLTSQGESRFQWMIGAFYENNKDGWVDQGEIPNLESTKHWAAANWRACEFKDQGFDFVPCPLPPSGNIWYEDSFLREVTQKAVFTEIGYDITDKLNVIGGFRYFKYDRYIINDRQWPRGLPVEAILLDGERASIEDGKESDKSFKLALKYTIDEDRMVYALFSQGFRLGGRNNPKAVRVNFVPEFFKPDTVNNFEVGLKSEWFDNRLQINATAFYMKWSNIQLNVDSDEIWWLSGQDNGGGARNIGIEMDVTAQVSQNLKLTGNVYVGDPIFTNNFRTLEGILELHKGTSMIESSRIKFSLAADYTIPDVIRGWDLYLRYDFRYRGPQYSNLDASESGEYNVDGFTMSNFQIGIESADDWTATLMIRNLLDARANTRTSNGITFYSEFWGHPGFGVENYLARPRTISLKFMKKF